MAWRGISLIFSEKEKEQKVIKICPSAGFNPPSPTWVGTTAFDKDAKGLPTPAWKRIMNNPEDIRNIIVSMNNISLVPIDGFISNGNHVCLRKSELSYCWDYPVKVDIKQLYNIPKKEKIYCVFTDGNASNLLVVNNKTSIEMEACGYTKKTSKHPTQESFAPLLIGVIKNKTVLVNSI